MRLPPAQAVALGVLQGPAELLPVSSSAHTSVVPWLFGWSYSALDGELQKSFEVALHAGAALAFVIALSEELELRRPDRQCAVLIAAASAPPALAGLAFERVIETRLRTPATIAAGLVGGSVAMVLADRAADRRRLRDAGLRDGLALGLAQACALVPGVSRAGASLSAARMLGFRASDARVLSDRIALPVLAGAAILKAVRLRRRGLQPELARAFAAGAAGSFISTLFCAAAIRRRSFDRLAPYAGYRLALAVLILLMRDSTALHPGQTLP